MDNNRIGFVNLNDQYRLNSSKSKRNQNGVLDQRVGKLASAKYRSNSHGSCDKDQSFKKSKMFNIGSRSNKNKNQKGGIAMGSSVINHNPLVPKSSVLKDAVSIRSFKEKPGISNSYEKKMLLENFKQYKPFGLRQNDGNIMRKENDSQAMNIIRHTNPNGEINNMNLFKNKNQVAPGTMYKLHYNELSAQTDCSSNLKKERPPSMRIKRSSSKKKSKKSHSNDARERSAGMIKIRNSSEDVDKRKTNIQDPSNTICGNFPRYNNLSDKLESKYQFDRSYWDKRFMEYTPKENKVDLIPKPDVNYLKKILETEKDERYRYLVKHGKVHCIDKTNDSIFIELPQIPNILIVYRRPNERTRNPERLQFNYNTVQFKTIPLLEGEEDLKTLLLDKNVITRLDNLISLPKLEVLDCSHNKLVDINEVKSLKGLRTLCLGFNCIQNIEPLKYLTKLKELDLQRNKITHIPKDSLSGLFHLQRMNLSFNLISQFSPEICSLEGLKELNLSNNKISEVPKGKCSKMCGLEILNLSSNNIEKIESIEGIQDLTGLKSLNLLSNPLLVMKQKHEKEQAMADIIKMAPHLTTFNCEEIERDEFMKPADNCSFEKENEEPKAQPSKNEFENMNSIQPTIETKPEIKPKPTEKQGDTDKGENVISIIEEEWDSEIKRLKEAGMYLTNYKRVPKYVVDQKGPDFDIKKANTYCIESGHAEIEANRVLLIFGNALEVLHREEFHECVEEIYIEYILAELLVKQSNLDQLKKFKKLKKLSISHNHLHSFIVLSKLECLSQLKILEIWNNEILKCRNLKSFVVYRFQYIESFNQHTIDDRDKKIAKMNFHVFDRLLSMELVTMPASTASKEGTKEDNKQRVRRHTDAAKAVIENLLLGCQNNCKKIESITGSGCINPIEKDSANMNILETKIEEMVIESCNSLLNFEETHTEEAAIAAILAKMNLKV